MNLHLASSAALPAVRAYKHLWHVSENVRLWRAGIHNSGLGPERISIIHCQFLLAVEMHNNDFS